jgi:hypothetical protein
MSKEYVASYAGKIYSCIKLNISTVTWYCIIDVIPNIYKFLREKILEGKICNKDKFNQKTMAILLGKCFGINRRVDFIN